VAEADPLRRYELVSATAEERKPGGQALAAGAVTGMTELAPPVLHTVLARAMSAKRLFNVTITNVPGSPRAGEHERVRPPRGGRPCRPTVGARGLSGKGYRGHVFWDSDVYVLPFLAATHPPAARAMLEYRVRRLPAAMRAARAQSRDGARFPWESAWSGQDVTPDHARGRRGELVPILTGPFEEHIIADVAWAAACYIDWTGDQAFAAGPGRELIVQTARWWASRIEPDAHVHGHIRGVIGPDEYHENVDDNAYTNVMARWNLKRAADAGAEVVDERERRRWLALADSIVDGYDPSTGIYEQFAGFNALEVSYEAEAGEKGPKAVNVRLV
jgi:trehalose/maltose hydrolase-like predicted phosphorylase